MWEFNARLGSYKGWMRHWNVINLLFNNACCSTLVVEVIENTHKLKYFTKTSTSMLDQEERNYVAGS